MDLGTSAFDRALHLGLFVLAGIAFASAALYVLERLAGERGKPTIKLSYVAVPVAAFVAVGIAERIYHLVAH